MTDGVDPIQPSVVELANIAGDQLDAIQFVFAPEEKPVDDADGVAASHELSAQLGSDVAGATGDENFQRFASDMNGVIGTLVSARSMKRQIAESAAMVARARMSFRLPGKFAR